MTQEILNQDSIMVDTYVSLFVLSKTMYYIKTYNASQVQKLKGSVRND
jgi:hypothetical protein